jgi:hypothetical protein
VVMHVDPTSGITVTGTINQAERRPDALARVQLQRSMSICLHQCGRQVVSADITAAARRARVEHGLVPALRIANRPPERHLLADRMARYQVPGCASPSSTTVR